ncbi:MAG: PaaI family thioesterase [Rubrivivax sp.]
MSAPPLAFPAHIPFVEALGIELWALEHGTAELRLKLAPEHLNTWQVAHGGVSMTLLDVAMAMAARSGHSAGLDGSPGVATIEMKTSFTRPGEGTLRATGRLLHRSISLAFCEGSVFDDEDRLCAHATGTFKYLKALPTRGRQLNPLNPTKPAVAGEGDTPS